MIDRLRDACPVALAVSLHAPDDALRDKLVPINRKYPIRMLLDACRQVTHSAGDYQVEGAKRFATLNIGGALGTVCSFVVGRE